MTQKTKIIFLISSFAMAMFIVVILLFQFWLRYFFVEEFVTITIRYDGEKVVTENLEKIRQQKVDPKTSIVGQWVNDSEKSCAVKVTSDSFEQTFSLNTQETFGNILPKGNVIQFEFCDEKGEINLTILK